nr:haloacid dehalogenase type II [arsenite-oxidising bacterium NT-25]
MQGANSVIKVLVFDAYGTLYDVQSVADVTDAAFPGYGEYITQVWRLKQLEYSWLRSMMGRYQDFWTVTRESLAYTLKTVGIDPSQSVFDEIIHAYNCLRAYPDAEEALAALAGYRLAILSNGSPDMLSALVRNSGLERYFEATISTDAKRVFKPDPRAYELVAERLGVRPDEVLFVSSNGFDVSGAKSFGFRVARIERVSASALKEEIEAAATIGPKTLLKALRMQEEGYGYEPDLVISSLGELSNPRDMPSAIERPAPHPLKNA